MQPPFTNPCFGPPGDDSPSLSLRGQPAIVQRHLSRLPTLGSHSGAAVRVHHDRSGHPGRLLFAQHHDRQIYQGEVQKVLT